MLEILVDNQPFETEVTAFAEILETVSRHLADSGRIVVEIRIDGRPVAEEELEQIDAKLAEAEELELISAQPQTLAVQALNDARQVLGQIRNQQQSAGEMIQSGQTRDALSHVNEALLNWLKVQQTVLKTSQLLDVDLNPLTLADGQSVNDIIEQLTEKLTGIRDTLMAGDWVALGDSMSYELDEDLELWAQLIDAVLQAVEQMPQDQSPPAPKSPPGINLQS